MKSSWAIWAITFILAALPALLIRLVSWQRKSSKPGPTPKTLNTKKPWRKRKNEAVVQIQNYLGQCCGSCPDRPRSQYRNAQTHSGRQLLSHCCRGPPGGQCYVAHRDHTAPRKADRSSRRARGAAVTSMTLQWNQIALAIGMVVSWSGFLIGIIYVLIGKVFTGFEGKVAAVETKAIAEDTKLKEELEKNNLALKQTELDLKKLYLELPAHYQRREDSIREYTVINTKLDRLYEMMVEKNG